jgi:hypothetical protein
LSITRSRWWLHSWVWRRDDSWLGRIPRDMGNRFSLGKSDPAATRHSIGFPQCSILQFPKELVLFIVLSREEEHCSRSSKRYSGTSNSWISSSILNAQQLTSEVCILVCEWQCRIICTSVEIVTRWATGETWC